jgi:hypothetical protein
MAQNIMFVYTFIILISLVLMLNSAFGFPTPSKIFNTAAPLIAIIGFGLVPQVIESICSSFL